MPVFDVIVLSIIVGVFCLFGLVLAFFTWYCSDKRKRPAQHGSRRDYHYPSDGSLIPDDD